MKLYYSPGACSLVPHILLIEAGLGYELIRTSTKTHQLEDGGDYYRINPLGYVPFLVLDDGQTMREATVVSQYIADRVPEKGLAPAAGTLARYRLLEWLSFVSTELHRNYSPLFDPGMPEEAKAIFRSKLIKRYTWLDGELKGRDFLLGNGLSVADVYLFVVTFWAGVVQVDLSSLANIQAFQARIGSRPAVQQALGEEGLLRK